MQMTADGQIHCLEVIIALIKKVLGDSPALNAMKVSLKGLYRGFVYSYYVGCNGSNISNEMQVNSSI